MTLFRFLLPTKDPDIIEEVVSQLSRTEAFGGCTVIPNCEGYWYDKLAKEIVVDDITIIESYTGEYDFVPIEIRKTIMRLKRKLNQKLIAYVINNDIHYI